MHYCTASLFSIYSSTALQAAAVEKGVVRQCYSSAVAVWSCILTTHCLCSLVLTGMQEAAASTPTSAAAAAASTAATLSMPLRRVDRSSSAGIDDDSVLRSLLNAG
jgi:hypothetical protein